MSQILRILQLEPSRESTDYVDSKQQFHLYGLLTEQRHPRTWNLSIAVRADTQSGLRMLFSVDDDITARVAEWCREPAPLEQVVEAVVEAVRSGRRIYVYGCGATGRLAKQMESTFWRPFWRKALRHPGWREWGRNFRPDIEHAVVGEMTGADRALVSSLEGFEDLQLIGKLQLEDHGIRAGDVVICVTEGGETSSVIGTALAAAAQHDGNPPEVRRRLYFVYNNPDEVLRRLTRSAAVLDHPAITKINLTTGPQAITGSTRMQATTIETFVLGAVFEEAVYRILSQHINVSGLQQLGFSRPMGLVERLQSLAGIRSAIERALPSLARFTEMERDTYRCGRLSTYFARTALITVFIDNTERSPTFRLYPLDRASDPERRCWVQVWTDGADAREAWRNFLGRPFRGLRDGFYREPFATAVSDPYLREAALRSLANAGDDQEILYDFSFSGRNIERKAPSAGDLGVAVLVDDEIDELARKDTNFHRFADLVHARHARLAAVLVTDEASGCRPADVASILSPEGVKVLLLLPPGDDPLTLRRQIALKMLLNAHSTAVMASLGKVIGNTMTNVSPSNLKLIGRATYLIMTHVNDALGQREWIHRHGHSKPVGFREANAVLFDAIDYVRGRGEGQTAEVALSIIRILEALRRRAGVEWQEAQEILDRQGLDAYLLEHNPALRQPTADGSG